MLVVRAARLTASRGELLRLAIVPALATAVCASVAIAVVADRAGAWIAFVASLLPQLEAERAIEWLWIGPARLALALARYAIFALLAAGSVAASLLLAALATSPVLDLLSQRVERARVGFAAGDDEAFSAGRIARDALRSVANEARRLAFFLGVWGAIALGGFVAPFGALLAPPLLAVFAAAYLPLEFAGFALDRRRVPFRERLAWLRANRATTLAFGATAFAIGAVPGLNFALLPVLVVAGTLLVIESEPASGRVRADSVAQTPR